MTGSRRYLERRHKYDRRPPGVTAATWRAVAERDAWRCQAPLLDPGASDCRGPFWGTTPELGTADYHRILTVDHVKEHAGGPRIHDEQHLILLCHHHNVNGWASAHRVQEREHLARLYPDVWADPDRQAIDSRTGARP